MDEPTTALDVVVQREILAELTDLRQRLGFSVIFITHDLSLLLELADKVAVMYAGRIVETATSAELFTEPCHPYTRGLLRSFPKVGAPRTALTGIPGSPPDLRALPSGCAFHPRCDVAVAACRCDTPSLFLNAPDQRRVACHLFGERRLGVLSQSNQLIQSNHASRATQATSASSKPVSTFTPGASA